MVDLFLNYSAHKKDGYKKPSFLVHSYQNYLALVRLAVFIYTAAGVTP
ncbi:MAG: hypothetical protein J6W29_10215 [Neisseriaceae bacterium]|nr:hypothetical protein [Neisseriaceae bacterium]